MDREDKEVDEARYWDDMKEEDYLVFLKDQDLSLIKLKRYSPKKLEEVDGTSSCCGESERATKSRKNVEISAWEVALIADTLSLKKIIPVCKPLNGSQIDVFYETNYREEWKDSIILVMYENGKLPSSFDVTYSYMMSCLSNQIMQESYSRGILNKFIRMGVKPGGVKDKRDVFLSCLMGRGKSYPREYCVAFEALVDLGVKLESVSIDYTRPSDYLENCVGYSFSEWFIKEVKRIESKALMKDIEIKQLDHVRAKTYFISHVKAEAGVIATMLRQNLILETSCSKESIFLDTEDLRKLTDLKESILKYDNMIILLTESYFTRPWCVYELYTAYLNDRRITPILITSCPVKFDKIAKDLSRTLLESDIKESIKTDGFSQSQINNALLELITKTIAKPYDPGASETVRTTQLRQALPELF